MRKDKERDDEKVIASLSDINTIKRARRQKDQIIKFIELENPITGFPRGTITFIAMLPSASLPELADCTIGEFKEAESFATSLCESIEFANNKLKKTDLDHSEALKKIAEESDSTIFFDIAYNDHLLIDSLPLNTDLQITALPLPYSGGGIDKELLTAKRFDPASNSAKVQLVAIAVRPKLTDIEKAILEKIPQNVGNFSIGNIGERAITVTTITIALFVLAVHCPTYGGRDFRLADQEFQFNPKELDDFKRLVSEGKVLPAADKIIQARSAGTFKVSKNFSL